MKLIDRLKEKAAGLKKDTLALWWAYKDKRTPWYAKGLAVLVVAYAFSPIDLVPDFIPVLGYLDDLILIPAGIALAVKFIPTAVMAEARVKAEERLQSKTKLGWWAAAGIITFWLIILALIGFSIYSAVKK